MGCNQSQDMQQMSHFQQQQYLQHLQQQQQMQLFQEQQYKMMYSQEDTSRINFDNHNQKIFENEKPIRAEQNNKTLEKQQKKDDYQLMRKQSILKKTQKIIQENLLCSQQLQSNQALSTRRHYLPDKHDHQLYDTNRQNTQPNFDDDTSDEEAYNKENMNPNIQNRQVMKTEPDQKSSNQLKGQGIYTMQDKINDHLRQFSNGSYGNSNQQQNQNKYQVKKKAPSSSINPNQNKVNQYINDYGPEEIKISIHSSKHIQKVNVSKPKKLISETQNISKVEHQTRVEVVEQYPQFKQQQQQQSQHQQQQQQQRVLNFQNKLHLLTMRKYSSNESSQNTSYQKITQRYNNQLSQNSSFFNQSSSLFNFRTGKSHEQCRQLYNEIEQLVKSRCSVHQYDAYHRFNTLIDKITQKNGEIKVHIITDTSSQYILQNQQQAAFHQNATKYVGSGLIQKIQNEIVNFEQFDLIENYLDENCISYDRRFFAKCVNNVKQLASLITQINFVFNYNNRPQSNSSSSSGRYQVNKTGNTTIKVGESFSIEIKVQRPFEEEQLNALSKQHSEYENIYEWYKINQASALGYGFVVNSCFQDEIYTFYIYHDDKNVNLQKALSAFSMYGASMNPSVQQKLEMIIPCNDFDIDFHFNQFGLVSIRLNLGKLSPHYETQLLNLYHTQISNCGSVKSFRGIENNIESNIYKYNQKYQSFKNSSNGTTNSTASSKNHQSGKKSIYKDIFPVNPAQSNFLNTSHINFYMNTLYIIEFNKQGFHLSKSEQIGQDDSAQNTQIVMCEQFK